MVALAAIKRQEIAALVTHAGRLPVFADDHRSVDRDAVDRDSVDRDSGGEVARV